MREQRPHQRQGEVEQAVGIEQRNPHRQRVAQPLHQLAPAGLLRALGHLLEVGRDLALQQVGGMQLRQQLDGLVLGRRIVARPARRRCPRSRASCAGHPSGRASDWRRATGGGSGRSDDPAARTRSCRGRPAGGSARVRPQPRLEVGDAVPRAAEQRCAHRRLTAASARTRCAAQSISGCGPDPGQAAPADVDLADALHAGPQPRRTSSRQPALDPEDVAAGL